MFNLVSEDTGEPVLLPVLKERFENYLSDEELSSGGWKVSKVGEDGQERGELLNVLESVSGLKSLKLSTGDGAYYVVNKSIALPERYPFDVSDEGFGIRVKKRGKAVMEEEARRILALRERSRGGRSGLEEAIKGRLTDSRQDSALKGKQAAASVVTESGLGVQSVGSKGTYYIYSFDGKLLAEYNGLGECMRDYIYLGDRLLAEYQPQSGALYYYTLDHINSVRVVTDGAGNRVFAAAYDPYGGIQKIWENSYTPAMKFSGKERDSESSLDYFGARYYGSYYYRWLSPDPVINKDAALTNPQLWNLYTFCRNNPVTYWDPDGAIVRTFTQAGYEAIQRTMGDAYLARNIYWDKTTGLIDINRSAETDNPNYLRLWYLIASPQEIVVSVTENISFYDKSENIYRTLPLEENSWQGFTVTPRKGRTESIAVHNKPYILCAIAPFENKSKEALALAHELYGHAFLYLRMKPFLHEGEPNGFVNSYIRRIEKRGY
ncbi:MAG: YD repeat protein [Candidatus Saccharicenans subterraneus]|uniref:YD repeat protein n=1 Tax=Candidatus Saccharicenans subterraneus TaxID=2508984 RepID=A0A3E2BKR2_9BACT|nr:MAG: YD repeat protein [Candidatus Saccharicenans subterraneum]